MCALQENGQIAAKRRCVCMLQEVVRQTKERHLPTTLEHEASKSHLYRNSLQEKIHLHCPQPVGHSSQVSSHIGTETGIKDLLAQVWKEFHIFGA